MAEDLPIQTLKERIASLNAARLQHTVAPVSSTSRVSSKPTPQPPLIRSVSAAATTEDIVSYPVQSRRANLPSGPPPLPVRSKAPRAAVPPPARTQALSQDVNGASTAVRVSDASIDYSTATPDLIRIVSGSVPAHVRSITNSVSSPSSADHESGVEASLTPDVPKRRPNSNKPTPKAVQNPPPPIPSSSRPLPTNGVEGRSGFTPNQQRVCMTCRDFSPPDKHAARFPRQKVATLEELAHDLTAPFPSITDKARVLFTWMHLNIDYNVRDFFSGNLKASTPKSTLETGLAVCEGYAALYASIATYAGLECIVVSGHGKGFGHVPLAANSSVPPYSGNHAWNAIKIDNGEWKLIDSTWGAGHVKGAGQPYTRKFAPERFTQSNEEFGIDHFPNNKSQFFLPDGRTMSWDQYIRINPAFWPYDFERPTFFDNAKEDYSIGKQTLMPPTRKIKVQQQGLMRFQFGLFCPHWSLSRHTRKGLPPVFILATGGKDGRDKKFVPFEHYQPNGPDAGGDMWYTDVPAQELGAPGETLTCFAVTSFGHLQDARGLSIKEFRDGLGRTGMGFVGIAAWELA